MSYQLLFEYIQIYVCTPEGLRLYSVISLVRPAPSALCDPDPQEGVEEVDYVAEESRKCGIVLERKDYYTIPPLVELDERVDKGEILKINDFIVGRKEYGEVCFVGETDVTGLDLDNLSKLTSYLAYVACTESKSDTRNQMEVPSLLVKGASL